MARNFISESTAPGQAQARESLVPGALGRSWGTRSRRRVAWKATGVLAVAAALVAGFILADRTVDPSRAEFANPQLAGSDSAQSVVDRPLDGLIGETHVAAQSEQAQPVAAVNDVLEEVPEPLQAEHLRLAIESTLVGQIDPGEFLQAALALTRLEISKEAEAELSSSGAKRYAVLGTPDGMSAELWVRHDANENFGNAVLTYNVRVKTSPDEIVEGAVRRGLDAQITVWTDAQGGTKTFGVLTDCMFSRESWDLGLGYENRIIPTGALFAFDPARPFEWTAKSVVLSNGHPGFAQTAPPCVGGQWPQLNDLELLKAGLMATYKSL